VLAVATLVPSGLNATALTGPSWPSRANSDLAVASNTRADPSSLAVATRVPPSGLNATARTAVMPEVAGTKTPGLRAPWVQSPVSAEDRQAQRSRSMPYRDTLVSADWANSRAT
jgi:hypothetical protein